MGIKIKGSGCYIPTEVVTNLDFAKHIFLNEDGSDFPQSNEIVAQKIFRDYWNRRTKICY